MSSIAYITDGNMIDFHRLNGNQTMNFWRPSNQKKFTDFIPGDLLFFLAKGTEKAKTKEKGIVGYGKLVKQQMLSIKKMWKDYGQLNGYSSLQELNDAIKKVTKSDAPKQLSCLYLEEVVYFQQPIYLSELGYKISNKIESYIYLDKDDEQTTSKILARAKDGGVDLWASALINKNEFDTAFDESETLHQISVINKALKTIPYSESDLNKAKKITKTKCANSEYELIKGNLTDCILYKKDEVSIAIPFTCTKKTMIQNIQIILGRIMYYKLSFKKVSKMKISFLIFSDVELPLDLKKFLNAIEGDNNE